MTIAALSIAAIAPAERAAPVAVENTATADTFAGLFALALNLPQAEAQAPAAKVVGTSELDQKDASAEADQSSDVDTGSVGENSERLEPAPKMPSPVAAAPTNEIVRSIAALDPQLQAKLQRVVARVERETGHAVTVTETYRSQSRQNTLYAQGRQTSGPVVTWTQSSKHTQGRAVDVALDNGNATPDAYRILQRIANEEGLQTLGPRDPGHLELPGNNTNTSTSTIAARMRADATSANPAAPADATGPGQVSIARLAPVARVAEVRVAQVAEVARPTTVLLGAMNGRNAGAGTSGSGSHGDSQRDTRNSGYASFGPTLSVRMPAETPSVPAAAPVAGSDSVARAERVLSAMDSAPARPLSHITMNVDAGNGRTDRVHVSLRGSALDTTIDTGDNRLAQVLSARSDELSRALSRDGIELRELRVRAAAETGTVTAAANGQAAQSSADASTQSRFDRGDAWQRRHDQQDQQDRQRSQQDRGRQQQRQRRGGEQ